MSSSKLAPEINSDLVSNPYNTHPMLKMSDFRVNEASLSIGDKFS